MFRGNGAAGPFVFLTLFDLITAFSVPSKFIPVNICAKNYLQLDDSSRETELTIRRVVCNARGDGVAREHPCVVSRDL